MCQPEVVPHRFMWPKERSNGSLGTDLVFCPSVICVDHILREVDADALCRVRSKSLAVVQHIECQPSTSSEQRI